MTKMLFFMIFSAILPSLLNGCSSGSGTLPQSVEFFNLPEYMGKWYEIARTPNFFERGLSQVTAEYTLHPDGKISIVNRGRKKSGQITSITGKARKRKNSGTRGELEVSFFPPFYSSYRVLATDYRNFAVISGKTTDLLWILSRKPVLTEQELSDIFALLKSKNITCENLDFP